MRICIFEDSKYDQLYPLTHLRPVWELKCGHTQLYQKILRKLGDGNGAFFAREWLTDVLKERHAGAAINDPAALTGDDLLLVNGRWLFMDTSVDLEGSHEVGMAGDAIAYARVDRATAEKCAADTMDAFLANVANELPQAPAEATLIDYPWDIIVNL